jgi:hypothetical protein
MSPTSTLMLLGCDGVLLHSTFLQDFNYNDRLSGLNTGHMRGTYGAHTGGISAGLGDFAIHI